MQEPSLPKLRLPFLTIPSSANNMMMMHSPDHPSGSATPPLQALASVPFKWEEQPGKPRRPCTHLIHRPEPTKFLYPPPCRVQSMDRITKTPSPTAVLDGPYDLGRPKFYSFRFFREAQDSSFYSTSGSSSSSAVSPESGDVKLLSRGGGGKKGRGYFGKFRGGSFRFSSPSTTAGCETSDESFGGVKMEKKKIRRKGSFSGVSHSHHANNSTHIWAAIYEGLKQVISWKSGKKSKKEDQY